MWSWAFISVIMTWNPILMIDIRTGRDFLVNSIIQKMLIIFKQINSEIEVIENICSCWDKQNKK